MPDSPKITVRLISPEMIYLQEKIKAESSNATDVIRLCIRHFYGKEDYFPVEFIRVCSETDDRITFRLEDKIYNKIREKSKISCGGSLSGYVHCAIGYRMALDDMGISREEFAAAPYKKSHDFDVYSAFHVGGKNLSLTVAEYKQALIGKHYRRAIQRLQK